MANLLNLVAIDNNERMVWNPDEGHLEVTEGETKHKFILTSKPRFVVKDVRLSPMKNLLSLAGDNGICIVELPKKWNRRCKNEKDGQIFCKTYTINERLFSCEVRLRALQVTWHPLGSESKQQLCILTNDNKLRFHDAIEDEELQVIFLRVQQPEYGDDDVSNHGISMSNLGESAISFDFGPPMIIQEPDVLYPIYILMGTGEILLVYTNSLNPTYAQHIIGPLTILPRAEDNYESNACSLIVLDTSPPLIAIATHCGTIYHIFAFVDKEGPLSKQTLYVYESLELSKDLIENPENAYNPHPMKLFKDPTSEIRYFCVHENGVHAVVLPILESLNSDYEIAEDKESFAEFIICTRTTTPTEVNELEDQSTPRGLGVDVTKTNIVLLVLMPNNELITQRISPATALINRKRFPRHSLESSRESNEQDVLNTSQIATRANFEEQIQQILKRKTSVPMFKLSEDLEHHANIMEVVEKTLNTFKIEYIKKYELASEAIKKKLSILEKDMKSQKAEHNKISKEKEEVYISVVALSSKAELACQKQKALLSRIDSILSSVTYGQTELSDGESKLMRDLRSLKDRVRFYRDQLDSIINKHKYHISVSQKDPNSNSKSDLMLSPIQLNGIKETLSRQGAEIADLKRVVKSMQ